MIAAALPFPSPPPGQSCCSFSLHLAAHTLLPWAAGKGRGRRQSGVFHVFSSLLTSLHSSTHAALCYSSRHRHKGCIKMSQASSSYLSFPQIQLSTFKQQSMQLTGKEKWFLMASPVTRTTHQLDSTTNVSIVIPINTVQQDRQDFFRKTNMIPLYYHLFIVKRTDLDSGKKGCFTRRTGSSFYWSFNSFSLLMADLTVTAEVVLEEEAESFACGSTTACTSVIFLRKH